MKDFHTVLFCIIMNSFSIYVPIIQSDKTQYSAFKNYDKGILLQTWRVFRTLPIFLASFVLQTGSQSVNQSINQTKTLPIYLTIQRHTAACCIELNSSSASQKFHEFLCNSAVHYRVHCSLHILRILSWLNTLHSIPSCFFKIRFEIMLPLMPTFTKWPCPLRFLHSNPACIFLLPILARCPVHLIVLH